MFHELHCQGAVLSRTLNSAREDNSQKNKETLLLLTENNSCSYFVLSHILILAIVSYSRNCQLLSVVKLSDLVYLI